MPHSRWESAQIGAGTSFSIDEVTDNAGSCRFQTTEAHGFAAGEVVRISGSSVAAYDGLQTITNVSDATHFDSAEVFDTDATATVTDGTATTDAVQLAFGERIVAIETPDSLAATADLCVQVSRDGTNFLDITDITDVLIRVTGIDTSSAAVQTLGDSLSALSFPLGACKIRLRAVNTASEADVNLVDEPTFRVLLTKD